jgi:CHAT domain-containing protein/Flp pilus assembly protein TadD
MLSKGNTGGSFLLALAVAAGLRAGGELTPEQHAALANEAKTLTTDGVAAFRQGKTAVAAAALEKALALYRRLYPKEDHPDLANALSNLAFARNQGGDRAGAEKLFREAMAVRRRLHPDGDDPLLAINLHSLAQLLRTRGDPAGAERHAREALTVRRKLYPKGDHPLLAESLSELGVVLSDRGDLAGAEALQREALALRRKLYPKGDHPLLAESLSNLGVTLQVRGDLAAAEPLLREALAMRRRLYPNEDHPNLAASLNGVGTLQQTRGNLVGAEASFREALAVLRRGPPDRDVTPVVAVLANLGVVVEGRGDLAAADRHFRESLALCRRHYPREGHPRTAYVLTNLGQLLQRRGDLAGAEPRLREALAMYRRLFAGRDHPQVAAALNNLGLLLKARGDLAGAEKHYRDALAMERRFYPDDDHTSLPRGLNNLGMLLLARGDPAGAEQLHREALAVCRRLYPEGDHRDFVLSLLYLEHLRHVRGDRPGDDRLAREALAAHQRLLFRQAGLAAEAEALNAAVELPGTRGVFLTVTRDRPDDATVYDLVWQGRSALTRLLEQRHRDFLASRDPATRGLGDQLVSARQRLARLLLAPARDRAKQADEVRTLTDVKETLEKELARKLRLEAVPAGPTPPPQRLAAALPEEACFIDFYHYRFRGPANRGGGVAERYDAFVLARGKAVVRVELGEAAPLEKAWTAWHRAITKEVPAEAERRAAAALARLLWDPLEKHLPPGARVLYLCPDHTLTQIPWAALPGKKPGTVLLEEYAFAAVPHGPSLLARLDRKGAAPAGEGTLLAVGGVDYRPPVKGPDRRGAWGPLPATKAEAERVAALAEKHAGLKSRRLSGAGATTSAVVTELPRARYAHLATHGFFADARFRSAFQVDPDAFPSFTAERRGGARSPLVLSGLVFAGANRTGDEADADRGILTAEALVGLRLDRLELAVLSACNTGLGEVGDEGVYGLQRAFHLAGCKDVIASLWAVEDESTAALMTLFYTNLWREKLTPQEALRQAQLYLYRHPGQVKQLARRDFEEVPLPREGANPQGPRARTAQWAAFTFSGVASPPRPRE